MITAVARAQAGDRDALSLLFNEYYSSVYYFALKTVRDQRRAEDITQETFIQVITSISSLRDPALFGSWLRSVTYNRCSAYFNKNSKEPVYNGDVEMFEDIREDKAEFVPDAALEKAEFRNTVLNIVEALPDEQRAAVLMYYFDELSVKQIAAIQGVSENTVKSRLGYARKYIKSAVEDYEKRNGLRLHSIMLCPLLYWLFSSAATVLSAPAMGSVASGVAAATGVGLQIGTGAQVASATGMGMQGSAANTVTKNVAQDAVRISEKKATKRVAAEITRASARTTAKATASKAGAGVAVKAGMSLGAKIIAGVVAAAVTAGAVIGTVAVVKRVQENKRADSEAAVQVTETVEEKKEPSDNEKNAYEVGNTVALGSYEQDNDTSNGTEPIEWTVLAVEDGRALVISKYAIEYMAYHTTEDDVSWEECWLRQWLNNDFYNTAFNTDEKNNILITHNINPGVSGDEVWNDTEDRVFLLSMEEAESYFGADISGECEATEYAAAKGDLEDSCDWWSRTPFFVTRNGTTHWLKTNVIGSSGDFAVRPAMWIAVGSGTSDNESMFGEPDATDDGTDYWQSFINNGEYLGYTEKDINVVPEGVSFEYVIFDLDKDGVNELLIQLRDSMYSSFFYTWVFGLESNEARLVFNTYGYGMFRYSDKHTAVLVSPEFRPFEGAASNPFYKLKDGELVFMYDVGDNGEGYHIFYGDHSEKLEDTSEYFGDAEHFEWTEINEAAPDVTEEYTYLDVIEEYEERFGELYVIEDETFYNRLSGVVYAELIDFDGDGSDELIICFDEYPDVDGGYRYDSGLRYHIYTMKDGNASLVAVQNITIFGNGGIAYGVPFCVRDGKYYIMEENLDDPDYYYKNVLSTLSDGRFVAEAEYGMAPIEDISDPPVYLICGEECSEEEYSEYASGWEFSYTVTFTADDYSTNKDMIEHTKSELKNN